MTAATIAGIPVYNCTTQFNSPADESLYGLGCHPEDSLSINYKGRNQDMAIKYMTELFQSFFDQRLRTYVGQLLSFRLMGVKLQIPSSGMFQKAARWLIIVLYISPISIVLLLHTVMQQVMHLCSRNGHLVFFNRRTGIKVRRKSYR